MATTDDKHLAKLLARAKKLQNQIAAKRARNGLQERKDEARRKIVAGAIVLKHHSLEPNEMRPFGDMMRQLLNEKVEQRDRLLFNLPPLPGAENAKSEPQRARGKKASNREAGTAEAGA